MKKSTYAIVSAALNADDTVTSDQRSAAVAILRERVSSSGPLPLLLTQSQVAHLLGMSRFTIRRLVLENRLHPVKILGAFRFKRDEVEVLAAGDQPGQPKGGL